MSKLDDIRIVRAPAPETRSTVMEWALNPTEKAEIKALFLELIGDNEALFGHGEDWVGTEPQNELKDELRKKVEEL